MSTKHNIYIIYGFPIPKPTPQWQAERLGWAKGGTRTRDLYEWLEKHYPTLAQHNAGEVNEVHGGAGPTYFVGVANPLVKVADYVRSGHPYARIKGSLSGTDAAADWTVTCYAAARDLGVDPQSVGFYVIGVAE